MITKEFLENFIKRLKSTKPTKINEENTKQIFIEPILRALDWDTLNLREVSREIKTKSGGAVDYVLMVDNNKIYLEAKPLHLKLTFKEQLQITKYAYEDNVRYCFLSNGESFQIFETFKPGNVSDRLLLDISLTDDGLSLDKKLELLNFISKESVKNGNLDKIYEYLTLQDKVNESIQFLLSNPTNEFVDLISLQIGNAFNKEKIKEAIKKIGDELNFQESKDIDKVYILDPNRKPSPEEIEEDVQYYVDKLPEFQDIFLSLRKRILELGDDITEFFFKKYNYIRFKRDNEFTTVKVKPRNKELDIFLKFGDEEPRIEDLSEIDLEPLPKSMRWGRVNYKIVIKDKNHVDETMNLIKQCYDLQLKWRK